MKIYTEQCLCHSTNCNPRLDETHCCALKFFSSNSIHIFECKTNLIHGNKISVFDNVWTIMRHIFNAIYSIYYGLATHGYIY